jgi:hypothetical protein
MQIDSKWIEQMGGEEKVKGAASIWLHEYASMCRVPFKQALKCAVVSDAGPMIQQGVLLLKRDVK